MAMPQTPKELFKLKPLDWLKYNGSIAFFKLTGLWQHSQKASGDIETMTFLDKVYWLYKTTNPIRKARRGSGLEKHFEAQKKFQWALPQGFQSQKEFTITAVGDLINHPFLANSQDSIYQEVESLIFGSDLPMANLECPIFSLDKKAFVFSFQKAPPLYYDLENFQAAKGTRSKKYAFMATACNHSLDFGPEGVASTVKTLNEEKIAFSGVNENERKAFEATVIEKNGFKIGLVAWTFGLNAYQPPKDQPRIVNVMKLNEGVQANDFTQMKKQLQYCQDQNVDFVIAHLHWGLEHEFYPMPEQVELAHYLAEMGVDLIIGHHPHVLQPNEFYTTKRDPNRVVPIYYSLGNLINTFAAPYLVKSGVAQITLSRGTTVDGTPRVYVKHAGQAEVEQTVDEESKLLRLVRV